MAAGKPRIVTLLTDFGTADGYVAQLKGAALGICPDLTIVDVTHEVPPRDIDAGGFALDAAVDAFPDGTVHVAVVDPGVGTARRRLIVRTERFLCVAPDNGVLSRVLERHPAREAWTIEAAHYMRNQVSATFEGRDVFVPAAAWLARGIEPSNFGEPAGSIAVRPRVRADLLPGTSAVVKVVWVDRFGNVTIDLSREEARACLDPATGFFRGAVRAGETLVTAAARTYGEAPPGSPFLLFGSSGHLEIARAGGSAAESLHLGPGDEVEVVPGVL